MVAHVAMRFNDRALQGTGTFTFLKAKNLEDRVIAKYLLDDSLPSTLDRAVKIIQDLLGDNPTFCETFSMEILRAELMNKQYLTINGLAVCIAADRCEPNPLFKDSYFTECTLIHPVKCSKGHCLEGDLLPWWVRKKGDICPAGIGGDNHPIGPLVVNEKIRTDMEDYIGSQNLDEKRFEKRKDQIRIFGGKIHSVVVRLIGDKEKAMKIFVERGEMKVFAKGGTIYTINQPAIESAALSIFEKARGFFGKAGRRVLEKSEKKAVEVTAKKVAKLVPVFCIAVGARSAWSRYSQGQYWRCAGEVLSAIAIGAGALCPPIAVGAPIVSFALDAFMLGADIKELKSAPSTQAVEEVPRAIVIQFDLAGSYAILGFASNPQPPPEQAQVDAVFTSLNGIIQLQDLVGIEVPDDWLQKSHKCMAALQNAREIIYQNKGWVIGP